MEPTFQSIGVDNPELFIKANPATAFFGHILLLVLGLHVFFAEVALLVIEVKAVLRKHLCEKLGLDLLHELIDGVAVEEGAFFAGMGMQIAVEEQPILTDKVLGQRFNCIATGLNR